MTLQPEVGTTPTTAEAFSALAQATSKEAPVKAPTNTKPALDTKLLAADTKPTVLTAESITAAFVVVLLALAASRPWSPVFVGPDVHLMLELSCVVSLGSAVAVAHACALWSAAQASPAMGAALRASSVVLGGAALVLPFVVPARHGLALCSLALQLWVTYWKVLDLVAGTGPPAVLSSPWAALCHFLLIVEYRTEALDGTRGEARPQLARAGDGPVFLRKTAATAACFIAIASLSACEPPDWLGGAAAAALRLYGEVWTVYGFLALVTGATELVMHFVGGFRPITVWRNPLTASTSPVDFWSRRWNLLVHGIIYRTVFAPLRRRGASPAVGALLAFAASGAFHEYAFAPASGGAALGRNLAFFAAQAPICSLERALAPWAARRAPEALRACVPLRALLTTALLVPFSPLFMAPLRAGGVLEQMHATVARVRVP